MRVYTCVCTHATSMGPGDTAYLARWSGRRIQQPARTRFATSHPHTSAIYICMHMHACAKKQHIYKALFTSPHVPKFALTS